MIITPSVSTVLFFPLSTLKGAYQSQGHRSLCPYTDEALTPAGLVAHGESRHESKSVSTEYDRVCTVKKSPAPATGTRGHEYELYHANQLHITSLFALPQIAGEKMNEYTFDYVERNRLNAFCKTVLRNEGKKYLSELARRRDREKPMDTLPQAEMYKLCTLNEYPSDSFTLSAFGYGLHTRDELVAGAFATLPEQEQQILILHFVAAMAYGEIGGLVRMSRSATIQRL